jgi:hypothetical protein
VVVPICGGSGLPWASTPSVSSLFAFDEPDNVRSHPKFLRSTTVAESNASKPAFFTEPRLVRCVVFPVPKSGGMTAPTSMMTAMSTSASV